MKLSECRVVDTAEMWLDLEDRCLHEKRSLVDALRWATGARAESLWHNAGNDAHMVLSLLRALLAYRDVSLARWEILGAYTVAQIPSVEAMRDSNTKRVGRVALSILS